MNRYDSIPEGFLAHWEAEGCPPPALVDWLLERGDMDREAECVRWCMTRESFSTGRHNRLHIGVRPWCYRETNFSFTVFDGPPPPSGLAPESVGFPRNHYEVHRFLTFRSAIHWLLENWKPC